MLESIFSLLASWVSWLVSWRNDTSSSQFVDENRAYRFRECAPPCIVQSTSEEVMLSSEKSDMNTTDITTVVQKSSECNGINDLYGPNLKILPTNNQVKELQTILRDKSVN